MAFLDRHSRIHCVGVGGIGISAIAKFLAAKGKIVSGSDATQSNITAGVAQLGIQVFIGHDANNVPGDADLIVYSEAVPDDNPERVKARELGVPELGHFDFLGELSKEYRTICVTGTNGKSTTTAMLGRIFETAGLDPTVFVGSLVPGWELGNLRVGKSDILIVEGDEYKQKMVKLFPQTTVITNIEEDHLDVYRDLQHIIETFQECADKTSVMVILNADDANSREITAEQPVRYAYQTEGVNMQAADRVLQEGNQSFTVLEEGEEVAVLKLMIPGAFNMMNALAAATVARSYDIEFAPIKTALQDFPGVWRRFERVGQFNGAEIISDYGHHPTAIKGTIEAAKEFFPGRRVVLCFQPHQHSRTKALFNDFVDSFRGADLVVLSEIYHVEGRNEEEGKISSKDLLVALGDSGALYAKDLEETETILRENIQPGDVVLIMGAGNIDEVARKLLE